jgi:Mg/Co/Ni transporter MgtE
MKIKPKAMLIGIGFGCAMGIPIGLAAGLLFQDIWVGIIAGGAVIGLSLDVLFNGSRCE